MYFELTKITTLIWMNNKLTQEARYCVNVIPILGPKRGPYEEHVYHSSRICYSQI